MHFAFWNQHVSESLFVSQGGMLRLNLTLSPLKTYYCRLGPELVLCGNKSTAITDVLLGSGVLEEVGDWGLKEKKREKSVR